MSGLPYSEEHTIQRELRCASTTALRQFQAATRAGVLPEILVAGCAPTRSILFRQGSNAGKAAEVEVLLLASYEDGLTEMITQVCRPAQQYRVTVSVRLTFKVLWRY